MIAKAGHYEPIAREGYPFIAPPALLALISWWYGYPWASLGLLALAVAVIFFFRNPERITPEAEGIVVSPADGTVMEVVEERTIRQSGRHSPQAHQYLYVYLQHACEPLSGIRHCQEHSTCPRQVS